MPANFEIIGSGHYVPGRPYTNADMARVMTTTDEWIYQRSGIRQRHFAPQGIGSSELGFEAAKMAIADAKIDAKEIDYILFATMTPEYTWPGSAPLLGTKLGLDGVPALDIRQQCAAMIFGLQLMEGLFTSGAAKTILFVGADTHGGFMPWDDWDVLNGKREATEAERAKADRHRAVAILFGDGAGALVLRKTDRDAGLRGAQVKSDGSVAEKLYIRGPSYRNKPCMNENTYRDELYIPYMEGKDVFKFAVKALPATARDLLRGANLTTNDVDWYLAHQANLRINENVRDTLGVPLERMPMNIDRFGNTSAGTLPILIDEQRRNGNLKQGQLTMLLALGAGFHWGGALWKM